MLKKKTRTQRKRIVMRRQRKREAIRNAKENIGGKLKAVLENYGSQQPQAWQERVYYPQIDGKRKRVILYVREQQVYAVFRGYGGFLYLTPARDAAILPHPERPTVPLERLMKILEECGIESLPTQPNRVQFQSRKPRLVKTRMA